MLSSRQRAVLPSMFMKVSAKANGATAINNPSTHDNNLPTFELWIGGNAKDASDFTGVYVGTNWDKFQARCQE